MPKAFLLKKEKSLADDLTAELGQVDVGGVSGVVNAQQTQVQLNGAGGKMDGVFYLSIYLALSGEFFY